MKIIKNPLKVLNIFFVLIFLSSCNIGANLKGFKIKNLQFNNSENNKESKEKLEIKISCDDVSIEDYLKKGWKISQEIIKEKICSWKSIPANDTCNIEKDKGCKIISPDKLGKEIIYFLEKDID